jgi:diaminopropionate ammonia-lyase
VPDPADELGVRAVLVKDESSRLGLPALRVLGASWAVAQAVAARTGSSTDLGSLRAATAGSRLRLVTATDGNHGRAVAFAQRPWVRGSRTSTPYASAATGGTLSSGGRLRK